MSKTNNGNVDTSSNLVKKLKDNSFVAIVGHGKMIFNCDCCNKSHLDWVRIESVLKLNDPTDLEGHEMSIDEIQKHKEEIDSIIEEDLYSQSNN